MLKIIKNKQRNKIRLNLFWRKFSLEMQKDIFIEVIIIEIFKHHRASLECFSFLFCYFMRICRFYSYKFIFFFGKILGFGSVFHHFRRIWKELGLFWRQDKLPPGILLRMGGFSGPYEAWRPRRGVLAQKRLSEPGPATRVS